MNKVRDIRLALNMTQRELGRRIDRHHSLIAAYESGQKDPSLETCYRLIRLAKVFKINVTLEDIRPMDKI